MTEQQLLDLEPTLADFLGRFVGCCRYAPTFGHLGTYVRGLLSELPRKSVEPIALKAGTPVRTLQEFLKDHAWEFSSVRERLAAHAKEQLATAADPQRLGTVGVIDETSCVKKGDKTPGVQKQYLGRVGKLDNGVVTVHLGVAKGRYKTLIDFDLFLPKEWSDDRDRCRAGGIPDELVHRTKWQIALEQVDRASADGVRLDWLTFDEEYGKAPRFLAGLDQRDLPFVGEVPRILSCLVVNRQGRRPDQDTPARTAEQVVKNTTAFREQSWTIVRLARQTQADQIWRVKAARVWVHGSEGWSARAYWLMWASNDETGEEKFFISNAPEDASIETLVGVAFMRWNVEHSFRVVKSELGFTHYEGRNYAALMRHMSLCLTAMAFVSAQAETWRGEKPGVDGGAGVSGDGGGGGVMAGSEARQHGGSVRQGGHPVSPGPQPRGAAVPPEAPEPTHAARSQETSPSTTQTPPSIICVVNLAL